MPDHYAATAEAVGIAPVADILITNELGQRHQRHADPGAENRALHAIADRLADGTPTEALQELMDQALLLCRLTDGRGTAGVSLLENDVMKGEHLFRWTALSGKLGQFVGNTTPRTFSPCGLCLDADAAILVRHPEYRFHYFLEVGLPIVEGLIVPFRVKGRPVGTIWIAAHETGHQFDQEDVRCMTSLANFTGSVYALLENQQDAVQADREKADLMAMISHDMRNPLQALIGWTHLLGESELDADARLAVERIRNNYERLKGLVDGLITFTRDELATPRVLERKPVPAAALVNELRMALMPRLLDHGITFTMDVPADLEVLGDRQSLERVLSNLLDNALKFTPTGGHISVNAAWEQHRATLAVKDTGCGIPTGDLERVFKPFIQLKEREGSSVGLGLTIARKLMHRMGGDLTVSSVENEGCTFTLHLRAAEPAPVPRD
ncbi:MAG TPA: GAF domain-containing sensor histidine kinase [Flavobacteriales bacterium]|jgi:signal transduction histidine kinase|nr:GAF domain-containing sensor histidine kinase [Flavobacteriales bacterium]